MVEGRDRRPELGYKLAMELKGWFPSKNNKASHTNGEILTPFKFSISVK